MLNFDEEQPTGSIHGSILSGQSLAELEHPGNYIKTWFHGESASMGLESLSSVGDVQPDLGTTSWEQSERR